MDATILDQLFTTIASRKGGDPASSYTAKLFAEGRPKIARKLGEEAVETTIAALSEGKDRVASESADLLYHLLVLWADCGIVPAEIWDALAARQGKSGIEEKNSRSK
ncbi:MAG TPA: phosphoribosyl-ATP diphosphatase [Magnetospirillaceae bacterium]|jgi:phosphoribosyl-ATP pyrophosphohydrolase